jgi:N6-adenosine-specific RNA methylase IME4
MQENRKYKVIYSDPPWRFNTWSEKGKEKSPERHYSCMSLEDIEALPVGDLADKNCILFMWVTDPLLNKQILIPEKWGFVYKTVGFYWTKTTKKGKNFIGCGYYTRANPEQCLIFTKGVPGAPKVRNIRRWITSPVREHSRKPDCIRDYISEMYDGPRLEMFARVQTPGWEVFGNETDKFTNSTLDI